MPIARLLLIMAVIGLVLTLPTVVSAQPAVHVFVGTASLDGSAAADGAVVTAWVAGNEVGTTTVTGGSYNLPVDAGPGGSFADETVSFMVGGASAAETADWQAGDATVLDLTASSGGPPTEPAMVATAWSGLDQYLTDGRGMTLYMFGNDTQGTATTAAVAACTGGCATFWTPLWTAGDHVAVDQPQFRDSASQEMLGTVEWEDGNFQATYNGYPLYYYIKDKAPGDVFGQYGPWFALAPQGTLLFGGTNVDPAGPPTDGEDGQDGRNGTNGANGTNGTDGTNGTNGQDGAAGQDGQNGAPGAAGADGIPGPEGDGGSGTLGIVALILAIIGLLGVAGVFLLRRGN